jgi:hypothetical protein
VTSRGSFRFVTCYELLKRVRPDRLKQPPTSCYRCIARYQRFFQDARDAFDDRGFAVVAAVPRTKAPSRLDRVESFLVAAVEAQPDAKVKMTES